VLPKQAWRKALDADGRPREGAKVAELTRWLPATFKGWPPGMRVIARRERPHPGAQLRITDADGLRVTAFATNSTRGQLPDLELRHRRRARAEDRIRCAKDTGLDHFPGEPPTFRTPGPIRSGSGMGDDHCENVAVNLALSSRTRP
jgi:hypothetical protein